MNRNKITVLSLVGASLAFSVVAAQDEEADTPPPSGAIVVRASSADGNNVVVEQAFIASSADGLNNFQILASPAMGAWGGTPDMQGMLQNQQVQQELGLVEDQIKEIQQIRQEFNQRMKEQSRAFFTDGKFDPAKAKGMREQMTTVRATMKKKLDGVLLPHQQKRLTQLGYHMEMKNRPGGQAIFAGSLADELELTDEQKEALRERAAEIEQEVADKIVAIRKKARQDLLKGLSPKQREKLDELLGDEFELAAPKRARIQPRSTLGPGQSKK